LFPVVDIIFIGTCQSDEQVANRGMSNAIRSKEKETHCVFGPEWTLQPVEQKERADEIALAVCFLVIQVKSRRIGGRV
jgi:hypothetical protein